ncbi:hypothetical protein EVAR_59422_1 [Eumeta japonica]|uniref:Uncharacterized protein n=1 Tax=Eumeta variegata TaxID=151549 RepID=A0A4C1Z1K6_EUMVA|nr:hypothetical protein EVAR_59422_1 [Eumeta japonica]
MVVLTSSSSLNLQPAAVTERDKSRYTEGSVNIVESVGTEHALAHRGFRTVYGTLDARVRQALGRFYFYYYRSMSTVINSGKGWKFITKGQPESVTTFFLALMATKVVKNHLVPVCLPTFHKIREKNDASNKKLGSNPIFSSWLPMVLPLSRRHRWKALGSARMEYNALKLNGHAFIETHHELRAHRELVLKTMETGRKSFHLQGSCGTANLRLVQADQFPRPHGSRANATNDAQLILTFTTSVLSQKRADTRPPSPVVHQALSITTQLNGAPFITDSGRPAPALFGHLELH